LVILRGPHLHLVIDTEYYVRGEIPGVDPGVVDGVEG
jgi:hypothetical protein